MNDINKHLQEFQETLNQCPIEDHTEGPITKTITISYGEETTIDEIEVGEYFLISRKVKHKVRVPKHMEGECPLTTPKVTTNYKTLLKTSKNTYTQLNGVDMSNLICNGLIVIPIVIR